MARRVSRAREDLMLSGVYRLVHVPSGGFYVGGSMCLCCRYWQWSRNITLGKYVPRGMRRLVEESEVEEWWFIVTDELPGADADEVYAAELRRHIGALFDPRYLSDGPKGSGRGSLGWDGAAKRVCRKCNGIPDFSFAPGLWLRRMGSSRRFV